MKKVTSVTIWNDSAGRRISVTYSEIDETTRKVVRDNIRENFILMADEELAQTDAVLASAQELVNVL